eukprot:TRINITY_DN794_c0_g1_i2.p1 TRINITY_DN794_c0_g1~~TRINITY_DN794_c0_g1_i2.p1  ORF type:complete len:238 (-),score=26.76 TRINITY_DN794_c0_g1_i2:55-768(-)
MSDLQTWWNNIPIVTRWLFALSLGLTIAPSFGLISPYLLILDFESIFRKLQLWRLVTNFCFHGKLGLPFLIHMTFLYQYGSFLENTQFAGQTADYLWFLIICGLVLLIPGYLMGASILSISLILAIIYYWSKKNPNMPMSFMFGLRFQSVYFPWVLIVFRVLMGGSPVMELLGILVGHVYYFFQDVYPLTSGIRLIKTPEFLRVWFQGPAARGAPLDAGARRGGHNWGQGYALGGGH